MSNFYLNATKIRRLHIFLKNKAGRNNTGQVVIKNRSYRRHNNYIFVDRFRHDLCNFSLVCGFLKQTWFNSFVNLIKYANGSFSYIISMHGVLVGSMLFTIFSSLKYNQSCNPGCLVLVRFLSLHTVFSNTLLNNNKYPKYLRAAGT